MRKRNLVDYIRNHKNSEVYECIGMQVILNKILSGEYVPGNDFKYNSFYSTDIDIKSIDEKDRNPELCSFLMSYCKCKLKDVPKSSRTKDFYINSFTDQDVYEYIKNNINNFDRTFFKDLIASNEYATAFTKNAFEIMPLEYIDEEMVSLALIDATDWSHSDWFLSVYKRKPETISRYVWICAARYYKDSNGVIDTILKCPDGYKDENFYLELLSSSFNCGMKLYNHKNIINKIPPEKFSYELLWKLLCLDINNISVISEEYIETILNFQDKSLTLWQFAIMVSPSTIQYIHLYQNRIDFFIDIYGKDSFYYDIYLKDIVENAK